MNLRQKIYDKLFGNLELSISTTNLYNRFLEKLKNDIKILDIGVGTGIYFENKNCVKLIKEKNIKIYGIDINRKDIELANKRIIENNLIENISVEYKNLFDIDNFNDYDIILFSESYPVINKELMFSMLNYIFNEKHYKNNLMFINNLVDNPTFTQRFKPYLRYILFGIDFGRVVTLLDMEDLFNKLNLKIKNIELLASSTINYALFRDKIKLPGLNFEMKQYLISIKI